MATDRSPVAPESRAAAWAGRLQRAALAALAGDAISAAAAAFGSQSPQLANVLLTAAMVAEAGGDFAAAQGLAERAAAVAAPLAHTDDPEPMALWADIEVACARLLTTLGQYQLAEARLAAATATAGRILTPAAPAMLAIDNVRGVTAKYAGRFDDAEIHYTRVLAALEAQSPIDEVGLAGLLHNLGGLCHARGRYCEGLTHAQRGLQLRIKALGPEHPDVARDLGAIGALHHDAGDAAAADAAYRQALRVFERALGAAHYEVGMICANLAVSAAAAGRVAESRQLYDRALTILEASVGAAHPDVALVQHNRAVLLADQDNLDAALVLLERAQAALASTLPADHPRRAELQATIAEFLGSVAPADGCTCGHDDANPAPHNERNPV